MQEVVTDAFVLHTRSFSNKNRQVDLFTKSLGRVKATVVSGSKTTSKLSPHLDTLNLAEVRLFEKNRFTVTDALTAERFNHIRNNVHLFSKALSVLFLLRNSLPEEMPDHRLWHTLISEFTKQDLDINKFLKILGYDPKLAPCFKCNKKNNHFFVPDQTFFCNKCSKQIPNEFLIKTT